MNNASDMNKHAIHQLILEKLAANLDIAQRAAQTAYETATHEENVAENKYDTLGLEASYLATGQARRMEEIRQALNCFQALDPRPRDSESRVQIGTLLRLEASNGKLQLLFLGPDAAGLKIQHDAEPVTVITQHSPLGQSLLGKYQGDEIEINVGGARQCFTITEVC